MQQPLQVQIVKGPLYKRILANPFKYYARMMGITFCTVSVTNVLSIPFDEERRKFTREHPEATAMSLFTKSAYFGILWPAFWFTVITSPRNAFVLWSSMEEAKNKL